MAPRRQQLKQHALAVAALLFVAGLAQAWRLPTGFGGKQTGTCVLGKGTEGKRGCRDARACMCVCGRAPRNGNGTRLGSRSFLRPRVYSSPGFARSVRWTGFLDRLTGKSKPLTAPDALLNSRPSALGPLGAATMPAPAASASPSAKADPVAKYVKDRGGNHVIRKVGG